MIPSFLIEKLKNQYGEELTNKILEGYNQKRKVTLRVNTIKANINEIQKILDNSNIVYTKVPWSDDALIIENVREPEITKLTIYDEGKIYLQSLSSMLPPIILQPKENDDILDMAAAPGGKTTQIASIVNNKARITACEMNNIRAEKLLHKDKNNIGVSIMFGLSALSCFNKNDKNKENNYRRNFGFIYGGPAVFSYMNWLKKQIIKENISYQRRSKLC